jgi:hypothetical protein
VDFVKNKLRFGGNSADPMARLMLTMLAGFATFECELIRDAIALGPLSRSPCSRAMVPPSFRFHQIGLRRWIC